MSETTLELRCDPKIVAIHGKRFGFTDAAWDALIAHAYKTALAERQESFRGNRTYIADIIRGHLAEINERAAQLLAEVTK